MAQAPFSFAGLENLWIKNGGSPEWAPTMAAVAMAESGGDPSAANASGATGIWQILSSAQTSAFNAQHPPSTMSDPNANARAAIALLGDGAGISNWTADPVGAAVVAGGGVPLSPAQAQQYASQGVPTNATLTADMTTAPPPAATFASPEAGVNPQNFHGFDLSAIPKNELGNAEQAIQRYIVDPGYAQQLQQRIAQDYGYHGNWIEKIPEVNAVLIWAATSLDPSTAAGQAQFQSAIANTKWWQTTSQYQRAWEEVQGTDPATAQNALITAQNKVLATANQIGVKLTAQQLSSISHMYASMSFTPAGTFSSQSGSSQEWLDQAVVDAVTTAGKGGEPSDFSTATNGETGVGSSFGITSQLFSQLQNVAQQYLMYNPSDPAKGLVTNQNILDYIDQQLQHYTGSGSFGSSNFINGVVSQYTDQMKEQASQMYPSLAGAISAGTTPQNYVAPTQNLIANTLGLNPSSVNFTDPQWSWAIATPDPKTGVKTALTQDQVLQKITNPSFSFSGPSGQSMTYADTSNAKQMANQFSQQFASAFGTAA